jgi:hypothetical protein
MTHHVITCPGQFMRHSLMGHCHVGLGLLALVIALDSGVEAHGKVSRFRIGPAQIRVAIFDVALPLAFAVAHLGAVDTATIGGLDPHTAKALDVPRFQQNRLGQNRTDPIDRLQQRILRGTVYPALDAFFHCVNLLG